jgi:solute carrier family 36 (proton-coupled amino acid transporter)
VLCLSFIALISLYSFLLLVRTKFVVPGSFGGTLRFPLIFTDRLTGTPQDIGGKLYGRWMRLAILSSITISQIGFVAAYTIFVAENLQSFVMAVTNCLTEFPVRSFILLQLVIFLPLALIRSLAKLSTTALVADGFILLGLLYIFGSEVGMIAKRGVADVKMFNSRDFPLFIG